MKVLTDIEIKQSAEWNEVATTYTEAISIHAKRRGQRLLHLLKKLCPTLLILLLSSKYDAIVLSPSLGIRCGLASRLIPARSRRKLVSLAFWPRDSKSRLDQLKTALKRQAIKQIDMVIVSSSGERERYAREYQIPRSRVRFIPSHTHAQTIDWPVECGDYVLSARGAGADYKTVIQALSGTGIKTIIVVPREASLPGGIPDHVLVYRGIPFERYLELLKGSRLVVLALKSERCLEGQAALLEAMGAAKAVLVSRTMGTEDYINDGVNGFFFRAGDDKELRDRIGRVYYDDKRIAAIGSSAREIVKQSYLLEQYVENNLREIAQVVGRDDLFPLPETAQRNEA